MPLTPLPPNWVKIINKPTTVAGYGITDMATQTVANATNATNATNAQTVTTITTAQVLAAEAGATVGSVGTYVIAGNGATPLAVGATIAGSSLTKVNNVSASVSAGLSGTWRHMGGREDGAGAAEIYIRIA